MFCSNCGSKLSEGARFCSICGAKLPEMPEQEFRTFGDFDFKEPKRAVEPAVEASKVIDEIPEVPRRESVSFDWSNVTDEPRKKEIPDIKSPWAATGGIDEKELYAEMTPSTEKSRTMNFIDVLKAEKEEKERKAADQAIEYTQVLELDADLTAFDEAPKLHYAPLYEDVDAPVRTPFDDIERKPEPVFKEEPRFEKAEPVVKAEPEVTASRETIAMFDDYVKSFEAGAGITREEPRFEDPMKEVSKFELPDFLRKAAGFEKAAPVEPEQPAPTSEFDNVELKVADDPEPEMKAEAQPAPAAPPAEEEFPEVDLSAYEIHMDDDPVYEEPVYEKPVYQVPVYEEPVYEEPVTEEPVFEEPKYDDGGFGAEEASGMEDMYLDMEFDNTDYDRADFGRAAYDSTGTKPEPVKEYDDEEEYEGIDEAALFAEMQKAAPKKTGMTIAAPADKDSEIEALKKRLAELMGNEEPAPAPIAEGAVTLEELNRAEFTFEPVINPEVDELFDGPIQGLQEVFEEEEEPEVPVIRLETESYAEQIRIEEPAPAPAVEPAYAAPAVEPVYEAPAVEPVYEAPVVEPVFEPAPVVEPTPVVPAEPVAPVVEPTPVVPAAPVEEPVPAVEPVYTAPVAEPVYTAPAAPVEAAVEDRYVQPAPVVVEEPVVTETVETEPEPVAPAPVEAPVVEVVEAAVTVAAEEEEEKTSDALSLEDIERDLFGDVPAADVEAEETKKIDKFYTLYRKNEEFQRLLDEEYDKLKGEENAAAAAPAPAAEPAAPAVVKLEESPAPAPVPVVEEQPVEDSKAYRQIEDETIYQAFEIPKELIANADGNAAAAGQVAMQPADKPLVEVETPGTSYKKDDKKAAKAAAKAEKARKKEEKKLAKAGRSAAAESEVEYEDVDSGSGFLTVLAVIIAIILVILLAVILILQVAPDSSIAIAIDSLIEKITGGFSLFDPGNGPFLL